MVAARIVGLLTLTTLCLFTLGDSHPLNRQGWNEDLGEGTESGAGSGHCIHCSDSYQPVCGKDGKAYYNSCSAMSCGRTSVACQGTCPCWAEPPPCPCTKTSVPVCGDDGKNYTNSCVARVCAGVKVECPGTCPCKEITATTATTECVAPLVPDPICGADGNTYYNECMAKVARVRVLCKGRCPCSLQSTCICACPCPCAKEDDPVCTTDSKTFDSPCLAKCVGKDVACKGECPCKPTAKSIAFEVSF